MMAGITLMHEHVRLDLSQGKDDPDCLLDDKALLLAEFHVLQAKGVTRMVDVSCRGLGRDYAWLSEVEAKTGLKIVIATGFYKEPFYPKEVYEKDERALAALLVRDILDGCEGSARKAALLGEIGTSHNVMTETEAKVFRAAARAQMETGVPMSTHTTLGTLGYFQTRFLKQEGVSLEKVIIGHLDLSNDWDEIHRVLDTGAYVEFDTIGKEKYLPDSARVSFIQKAIEMGYEKQLLLSMDITRKSHLKANGGVGYAYLFERFLPRLREKGVSEAVIQVMLIDNPQRILEGET